MWKKTYKSFTLLEILICIALLGMAAVSIGWQMQNMIAAYRFQRGVNNLVVDLRKSQLVALCDRIDLELQITKKGGEYQYAFYSDDPIPCFLSKSIKLRGVTTIEQNHQCRDEYKLPIYACGRVGDGSETLTFGQNEETKLLLDLSSPLFIDLKRLQPSE